jgi:hypothetical protein
MKKLILIITILTFTTYSFSQEISKYVVSSSGNYATGSGYSISSTIGQEVAGSLTGNGFHLSQGFQTGDRMVYSTSISPMNQTVALNSVANTLSVSVSVHPVEYRWHKYSPGSQAASAPIIPNETDSFFTPFSDTIGVFYYYCNVNRLGETYKRRSSIVVVEVTSPTCNNSSPTGAFVTELIHDRVRINWDNMNDANCMVTQYRIKYRELGTSNWSQKNMSNTGLCVFGLNTTSKRLLGLSPSTTYEYYMKAWYCGGDVSDWSAIQNFTTEDECPNIGNFTAYGANATKATFDWDDSNGSYEFVRIKMRVDSISNPSGSDWFQVGGFGVTYGIFSKNKNGLVAGQTYRAQARAWCDPNGGAYNSLAWTALTTWTQPTSVRVEGGIAINNLAVYPNPSRDIFNVSFVSEDAQDLKVRIINVVGEVIISEDLEQFIGEYTKQIDLASYIKGIYFLEITTNNGVVNKKLILQ